MQFKIDSEFNPTGDQPQAIKQLVNGINTDEKYQTLLGVTGSGKTFTVANVIEEVQRPTLVLAHNKTLAAQLYSEFKQFFPENAVEYFVSYYDYYQPEAYIPVSGVYIEKDLSINEEIEKMRFLNKLDYEIIIDEELHEQKFNIPTMILQPIVENSIKHGFQEVNNTVNNIQIQLFISNNDFLICEISDNGVGNKNNYLSNSSGISLENIESRLQLMCETKNKEKLVTMEHITDDFNKLVGFKVILKIPLIKI